MNLESFGGLSLDLVFCYNISKGIHTYVCTYIRPGKNIGEFGHLIVFPFV